jgi:hypothetical protein
MRNLFLAATVAALTSTSALAGGYVAPVVEAAPVVVAKSSSSSSIWIPIAILVLIGLAVSHHRNDDAQPQDSDIRLKTDITRVGTAANGLPLYHFRYRGLPTVYEGVMAQDVLQHFPEAVVTRPGGILAVNYGMLGLEMKIVH